MNEDIKKKQKVTYSRRCSPETYGKADAAVYERRWWLFLIEYGKT